MKRYILTFLIIFILITLFSCAQDISNIIKKVKDLKVDIYKTKGIITKIFFLDTDKIYLYELTSEKNPNEFALLISNNKYRRGDKPEIVVESFRLKKDNFEEKKDEYHSIIKNYILKKTIFSNTEIILLILKIDIIVKQYLEKNESVVVILESHQNTSQE